LAEQLLAYSRVAATGFESRAPLDLAITLDSVIEMMEPIFQQRGQSIRRVILGPLMIEAVRFKIEQLTQNLLANASAHGNQNSSIAIEAFGAGNFAELIIDNEGPCLLEEELTKVFIPHYRASGTKAEGNGLGLAIVQEIVGQHGGEVYLENRENPAGIRATVRLPLMFT
jgi:two-component system OmpR family sensor kinase